MDKKFNIEGMSCQHCVGRVKKTIEKYEGVSGVSVNLEAREAVFKYENESLNIEEMIKSITELGFKVSEKA